MTLLLLARAGAASEGFLRLLHAPLGYDPHNVISIWVPFHENSYTTWAARLVYFEQLQSKLRDVPGVTMTATATNATPPQAGANLPFRLLGEPALEEQTALVNLVDPEFFRTLRIAVEQGRIWNGTENHNAAHLAVINQTMAHLYFPKGDAVGKSIKIPSLENQPPENLAASGIADSWLQIVGVVGDSRNDGLRNPIRPAIFVPYTFYMPGATQILV
ncbi:ABC transporter permease [Acidobacterium sp. S8]|uniref:ABC transporter permease n=1 Tax=Acidobacterium sp. S8 TaxID=1641854 RepID=UPI0020B13615|nr:ABC transporter permease [Acidobacterium sp. S8]